MTAASPVPLPERARALRWAVDRGAVPERVAVDALTAAFSLTRIGAEVALFPERNTAAPMPVAPEPGRWGRPIGAYGP